MRKIKVFDYTFHVMHQLDMITALKDDCEFYYCTNSWREWRTKDFTDARPVPENIHFVPYYEPNKYDVAIIHWDAQCINQTLYKGKLYHEFNNQIKDIPKIVINHTSPVYPEYGLDNGETFEEHQKKTIEITKKAIGDNIMVVNSHYCATEKEWGWGVPIVHGMDSEKFKPKTKEPRVFTALSPYAMDTYYNRQCMEAVAKNLEEFYGHTLWWAKLNVKTDVSFETYKDYLAKSLIYIDTSIRTPMNRARTEAMLSGCCVVQVEGAHDLDRWAKHNENIILVPNQPKVIAQIVTDLIENQYDKCIEIGKKARETAIKHFNYKRYRQDWIKLLKETIK